MEDVRRGSATLIPMSDWKARYESAADDEAGAYARLPVARLLDDIRRRRTGGYSTIWGTLAERATPEEAGWVLYEYLLSDQPYLERYHCASALLRILRCTEFEAVELSASWPVVGSNLARLRNILEETVGLPGR